MRTISVLVFHENPQRLHDLLIFSSERMGTGTQSNLFPTKKPLFQIDLCAFTTNEPINFLRKTADTHIWIVQSQGFTTLYTLIFIYIVASFTCVNVITQRIVT